MRWRPGEGVGKQPARVDLEARAEHERASSGSTSRTPKGDRTACRTRPRTKGLAQNLDRQGAYAQANPAATEGKAGREG